MRRFCQACCYIGSDGIDENEDKEVYDSYQSKLNAMMTVLTLIMGFSITGAVITINFEATDSFQSDRLILFVTMVTKAILCSASGLGITFLVSVVGAQIRTSANGVRNVIKFFKLMGVPILIAEVCIYWSLKDVFKFTGQYIKLAYSSPSRIFCPHRSCSHDFDPNAFCARVSKDLWDAATSKDVCGSPQKLARMPINNIDMHGTLCMVVDIYAKSFVDRQARGYKTERYYLSEAERSAVVNNWTLAPIQKVWFGYYSNWSWIGVTDDVWTKQVTRPKVWVDYVASRLGSVECGTAQAKQAAVTACEGSATSIACASAKQVLIQSSDCADGVIEDVWKCSRACDWIDIEPETFLGFELVESSKPGLNAVSDAYKPIAAYLFRASLSMYILVLMRVLSFFVMRIYRLIKTCMRTEPQQDTDSDDDTEMQPLSTRLLNA